MYHLWCRRNILIVTSHLPSLLQAWKSRDLELVICSFWSFWLHLLTFFRTFKRFHPFEPDFEGTLELAAGQRRWDSSLVLPSGYSPLFLLPCVWKASQHEFNSCQFTPSLASANSSFQLCSLNESMFDVRCLISSKCVAMLGGALEVLRFLWGVEGDF